MHLLAGLEHDHKLASAGDPDVAFVINSSDVAGAEPLAYLDRGRGFGRHPVSRSDVSASRDQFALTVQMHIEFLLGDVDERHLDTIQCRTYGADVILVVIGHVELPRLPSLYG